MTLCCLILLPLLLAGNALAQQNKVLVIQSYDRELDWTRQCDVGIARALTGKADITTFYLNTKWLAPSQYQQKADEALALFHRIKPDVVMLGDDNALRLLGPGIAKTGIPVIYFGINNNPRSYFDPLPNNVGGIIERIPLLQWVRLISDIVPGAEDYLIFMDGSTTAQAIAASVFKGKTRLVFDSAVVTLKSTSDWDEWRSIVRKAGEFDVVVMPVFHTLKDGSGRHVPYNEVVFWTSLNCPVPVFATQDYAVGDDGVIGAYVVHGEEHGYLAGKMVSRLLEGEPVCQVSVQDDQQGFFVFNQHQLDRYGLVIPDAILQKTIFK